MKIGFIGLLTIVFVLAKLGGYTDWSWWVVFSPLWIGAITFVSLVILHLVLTYRRL